MESVLIVIHLLIVVALVVVVLLQRSEGGALGIGGGGGGGGGFMSARGAANALTRTTAILAACFFATSIALGILSGVDGGSSVLDNLPLQNQDGGTGEGILDQLGGSDTLNLGGDNATEEGQVPTTE
ncbi:MAG: preprotein translocase subunit SecG [Rhizobiaceae bacterium]|nr:preprotein translocase subunit SecG [Rhizobiaceae bacterium]